MLWVHATSIAANMVNDKPVTDRSVLALIGVLMRTLCTTSTGIKMPVTVPLIYGAGPENALAGAVSGCASIELFSYQEIL
jgi:hypothetical protein